MKRGDVIWVGREGYLGEGPRVACVRVKSTYGSNVRLNKRCWESYQRAIVPAEECYANEAEAVAAVIAKVQREADQARLSMERRLHEVQLPAFITDYTSDK